MVRLINPDTITKAILILTAGILAFCLLNHRQQDKTIRDELIKQISKRLIKQEIETFKRIQSIEQRIRAAEHNDTETKMQIEETENNYKNIIRNLKIIDNDKTAKDLEIINTVSSSDWSWFNSRFPKSKNDIGLSTETGTIIRESSQIRQSESH